MERFEAFENIIDLAKSLVTVCELIISPRLYTDNEDYEGCTDGWSWDSDTKTRAQGILASFRNFKFSVCIVALKNILMPLRGITSKLQKRDLDTYEDVESVVKDVETIRRGIDERYESWYEENFSYNEMHWRQRKTTSSSWTAAEQIQSPSK